MATIEQLSEQLAALEAAQAGAQTALTHTWLILCGALVMFMHAGFALLESGCCRQPFTQSILMKNLLNCCVGTLGWWSIGYGLAYGPKEDGAFAGTGQFFNHHFVKIDEFGGSTPEPGANLAWFFQWAFCMTAATIVSGAVAERLQLSGYIVFAFFMTAFVYPLVVSWTWAPTGWLNSVGAGYVDFAGSGIVHLCGGTGALVGSIITGPRKGRFEQGVDQDIFLPHNVGNIVLGTIVLWFGWYGFNCGSTLSMTGEADAVKAAHVAVNTTIAPACGGLVVTALTKYFSGRWNVVRMCCGILAGLVSITAGCGNVQSWAAVIIGSIGGCVYYGAMLVMGKFKIDDPVEAFPVHGACGLWGVIAAALFDFGGPYGTFHGWGFLEATEGATVGSALYANLVGALVIFAWSASTLCAVFGGLSKTGFLCMPEDHQIHGADRIEFTPKQAYQGFEVGPALSTVPSSASLPSLAQVAAGDGA